MQKDPLAIIKAKKANTTTHFRARRDEKDPEYKTAVLVDRSVLPPGVDVEAAARYLDTILTEEVIGHRPINVLGSPANSPKKRPKYVVSPGTTKYYREKSYGCMLIYSNKGVKEVSRLQPDLERVDWLKRLQASSPDCIKMQEILVTSALLEKTAEQRKAGYVRGKKGIKNQNSCLAKFGVKAQKASATKIAKKINISQSGELWEWLHLIAFFILGGEAQTHGNLTAGTKPANTDMIFSENLVDYLARFFEEGVKLIVTSEELPNCHLSKKITYRVITPSFELPFVFNSQTSIQPSLRNQSYLDALVSTLLEKTEGLLDKDDQKLSVKRKLSFTDDGPPAKKPRMPMLFFHQKLNKAMKKRWKETMSTLMRSILIK